MKLKLSEIWHLFLKYFGQGLLFITPISATIFIFYILFEKVDTLLQLKTPGLGLLIIIFGVTILGIISSLIVTFPLSNWANKIIHKTPIIKIIYTSVSDLLSAFVGNKKKFTKAVLVKLSSEYSQIGFLTQDNLEDMNLSKDLVSVYIPFSYSLAGNVYIVKSENITPLDIAPAEAMKFVISGGISNINEQRKDTTTN